MQRKDSVLDDYDAEKGPYVRPSLSDIAEEEDIPFIHEDEDSFNSLEKSRYDEDYDDDERLHRRWNWPQSLRVSKSKILGVLYGVCTALVIAVFLGAVHTVRIVGLGKVGVEMVQGVMRMGGGAGWSGLEGLEYLFVL